MDALTTRDGTTTEPKIEDSDILLAFAHALSDPKPEIIEPDPDIKQEAFLKLARAH